jgi:hypothetical protein
MHWAARYINEKWSKDQDCFYWYRRIKLEQFGREVPVCDVDHSRLVISAARAMNSDIGERFGYHQTDEPREGDAVFLSQRSQPHHIGMVIFPGGKFHILHVLEGSGVIISDLMDLKVNGWKIRGYWTDES